MRGPRGVAPPAWARALLRWLAPPGRADELVGDLEEAHRRRLEEQSRTAASLRTALEALDVARALLAERLSPGVSWLDFKLGLRMLVRYPGLTMVGGLTLAATIGGVASWYELDRERRNPTIPLPEGDRLVRVELRNDRAEPVALLAGDVFEAAAGLPSLAELGAYRSGGWNLLVGGEGGTPLAGAAITPSALRLARVAPSLGRLLREEDVVEGAPPVVLVSHDVWRSRLGGDPGVVGRRVRLGGEAVTVVGVMPPGFAYPVNHRIWRPLAPDPGAGAGLSGARIVGRLAAGATAARAEAELTSFLEAPGRVAAASEARLRVRVLPYAGEPPGGGVQWGIVGLHLAMVLILVAASVNIATLMYARTATRAGEMAVRSALGAGRTRIVGQLVVEALVLSGTAAVVGLVAAQWGLQWILDLYWSLTGDTPPFWFRPGLAPSTMLFAAGLAGLGAVVVGLVPAVMVTRRELRGTLQAAMEGGERTPFGGVWGWIIVAQVAFTVFGLLPGAGITAEALRDRAVRADFPSEAYLTARIEGDPGSFAASLPELERRLRRASGVADVTFTDLLPGVRTRGGALEVDTGEGARRRIPQVWMAAVDDHFAGAFGSSVMAGRGLHAGDAEPGAHAVVVNRAFARRFLGGANPVGARLRAADRPEDPWREIVGMVDDVGLTPTDEGEAPFVYYPLRPASRGSVHVAVRLRGEVAGFGAPLRAEALEVDPRLRIHDVQPLDEMIRRSQQLTLLATLGLLTVIGLGLLLAAAGIFALTSLAVSRRRHEIGVRRALGAGSRSILASILGRAAGQVALGIALGNVLLAALMIIGRADIGEWWGSLLVVSAVVAGAAVLACVPSARRALATQPVEVLKAE